YGISQGASSMATDVMMPADRSELRAWNVTLWISQLSLAWLLTMVGVVRLWLPVDALRERLPWADASNADWVRFSGWCLLGAALALVLPPLMGMAQRLVPATAMAMMLAMIVSAASHI